MTEATYNKLKIMGFPITKATISWEGFLQNSTYVTVYIKTTQEQYQYDMLGAFAFNLRKLITLCILCK